MNAGTMRQFYVGLSTQAEKTDLGSSPAMLLDCDPEEVTLLFLSLSFLFHEVEGRNTLMDIL